MLACVAAFYSLFLWARLDQNDALWFVHLGQQSLEASTTSRSITPALGSQSPVGYDGQYYFFLAVDPVHARDYMIGPDDEADRAGYVYSRPLYPALARAGGLGSARRIPYAMLAINLLAVGAGTLAVALWLRRHSTSPWFGLLYGL